MACSTAMDIPVPSVARSLRRWLPGAFSHSVYVVWMVYGHVHHWGHLRLSSILCLDLVLPSVAPDAVSSSLLTNCFFQNLDPRCFPNHG